MKSTTRILVRPEGFEPPTLGFGGRLGSQVTPFLPASTVVLSSLFEPFRNAPSLHGGRHAPPSVHSLAEIRQGLLASGGVAQ